MFAFDSSIKEFLKDNDLNERICYTARQAHSCNGQAVRSLPGVTVRLVSIYMKLEAIESRLDDLGIRTDGISRMRNGAYY